MKKKKYYPRGSDDGNFYDFGAVCAIRRFWKSARSLLNLIQQWRHSEFYLEQVELSGQNIALISVAIQIMDKICLNAIGHSLAFIIPPNSEFVKTYYKDVTSNVKVQAKKDGSAIILTGEVITSNSKSIRTVSSKTALIFL